MITYYRNILKYIVIISLVLSSLFILNNYQKNKAEVIIGVNNLNSPRIMNSLKKDFNNHSGIKFVDGSLMSNTIVLEIEDNNIEVSTLSKLLENWGCTIESISYRILNTIK
jgi:hypothetical protein